MNTTRQNQRRSRPNRHGGAQAAPSLGSQIDETCRKNSKVLLFCPALSTQHFAMPAPDTAHVSKTPFLLLSNHNSSPEGPPYPTAWSKRESASPPCGYVVWCGPLLPSCTPRTSTFGQSIRSHAELPRCLAAVSDYAVSFHAAPGAALAIVWSTARKQQSPQGLTVPRRNLGSLRNDSQSLMALGVLSPAIAPMARLIIHKAL